MGNDHAFDLASRAAGAQDFGIGQRVHQSLIGQRREFARHGIGVPASVELQCSNERVRFGNGKTGCTKLSIFRDFFWGKPHVDGTGNAACATTGENGNHHFEDKAVADSQKHPVAGLQSGGNQSACNLISRRIPLREGQLANAIRMGNFIGLMMRANLQSVRNPSNGYAGIRIGKMFPCTHSVTLLSMMHG